MMTGAMAGMAWMRSDQVKRSSACGANAGLTRHRVKM